MAGAAPDLVSSHRGGGRLSQKDILHNTCTTRWEIRYMTPW